MIVKHKLIFVENEQLNTILKTHTIADSTVIKVFQVFFYVSLFKPRMHNDLKTCIFYSNFTKRLA